MPWQAWTLVVLYAYSALSMVARVGKPRKPIAPEEAACGVILAAVFIWAIVSLT